MPDITRTGNATWSGDVKGRGTASTPSGALEDVTMTIPSRFQNEAGSNPEELIAAAHAACFSMQLGVLLARAGTPAEEIRTQANLTMRQVEGGWKIYKIHLDTDANVPGIDEATFKATAEKAKEICPVSGLLKPGLEQLTLDAKLVS